MLIAILLVLAIVASAFFFGYQLPKQQGWTSLHYFRYVHVKVKKICTKSDHEHTYTLTFFDKDGNVTRTKMVDVGAFNAGKTIRVKDDERYVSLSIGQHCLVTHDWEDVYKREIKNGETVNYIVRKK